MGKTIPNRASLWREAMRDLVSFSISDGLWIAFFAMIAAIEQRLTFFDYHFEVIQDQLLQTQGDPAKTAEIISPIMPHMMYSAVMVACVMLLSTYAFTVVYLRFSEQIGASGFSVKGFFYWLGQIAQKYLILLLPYILIMVASDLVGGLRISDDAHAKATTLFLVLTLMWWVYFTYGFCALIFVSPLAVLRKAPVIKTSFELSKKHFWRIGGDWLILATVLSISFLPLYVIDLWLPGAFGEAAFKTHTLSAFVNGLMISLTSAGLAIFSCVTYRILLQEQKDAPVS